MAEEELALEKAGGVATLSLNRPAQLNALTLPVYHRLVAMLEDIGRDESTRAVVITGRGRGFCAGIDLGTLPELGALDEAKLREFMGALTLTLYHLPQTTIAAVNGVTAGLGLALACLCDLRIGGEAALFTSGYVRIGLPPDIGATFTLPRIIGTSRALEMMLTGETVDSAEAYRIGLLNRVVPTEETLARAQEIASAIAGGPSAAIRLTREGIRDRTRTLAEQVGAEAAGFYRCLRTGDHREGLQAFREKRTPRFTGR
ncbi:MAG: enoyl-CoA hydratase-related protein [Chloroflexota bacterium]